MAVNVKQAPSLAIKVTLSSTVSSGDVMVLGDSTGAGVTIGIAMEGGVSGDVIAVAIAGGVFTVAAVSAAVIAAGETVDWDTSASAFDDNQATSASGDVPDGAVAVADSGNGDTTVDVTLVPGLGVLTA